MWLMLIWIGGGIDSMVCDTQHKYENKNKGAKKWQEIINPQPITLSQKQLYSVRIASYYKLVQLPLRVAALRMGTGRNWGRCGESFRFTYTSTLCGKNNKCFHLSQIISSWCSCLVFCLSQSVSISQRQRQQRNRVPTHFVCFLSGMPPQSLENRFIWKFKFRYIKCFKWCHHLLWQ